MNKENQEKLINIVIEMLPMLDKQANDYYCRYHLNVYISRFYDQIKYNTSISSILLAKLDHCIRNDLYDERLRRVTYPKHDFK
jgi:hypothetical protein